jgi:hypothetical protein
MEITTEITNLCTTIGVTLEDSDVFTHYDFSKRKISIAEYLTQERKLIALSHELGHAMQSANEFEKPYKPSYEEKVGFVLAVENDAWDKGEAILSRLYPDLTPDFWVAFFTYRTESIASHENAWDVETLYPKYVDFIFTAHRDIKPMCLNTFQYN